MRIGKYILETVRNCQQREKFFTVRAPETWNSLVGAGSVVSFKRLFDEYKVISNKYSNKRVLIEDAHLLFAAF